MKKFIPGLRLSELFYKEAVEPLIKSEFPKLKYSAALIGPGSEVLGLDTLQSRDHHWGPRAMLFLSEKDYRKYNIKIKTFLSKKLPYKFMGYSTNFGKPDKIGVQVLEEIKSGPINHRVEVYTMKSFFKEYLGIDPSKKVAVQDWLTFPEHRLLSITRGKVFHDDLGLNETRKKFEYYPEDVWLYILSSQWSKISQEEAFASRCGDAGDELGSKIIAARMVKELMRLCFIMEKEYAPYSKWFGTTFSRLRCSKKLTPIFHKVLASRTWKEREKYISDAYEEVARIHNNLRITRPMPAEVSNFHDRTYLVIHAQDFAIEIRKSIKSMEFRKIKSNIGSADQFTDSIDLIKSPSVLKVLYKPKRGAK